MHHAQHPHHDIFVLCLHAKRRVRLRFRSKDDFGAELVRICAPLDFGPSRRAKDKTPRYHLWDFESDSPTGNHVLGLPKNQIVAIEQASTTFDPAEIVTWDVASSPWHLVRDWGVYS